MKFKTIVWLALGLGALAVLAVGLHARQLRQERTAEVRHLSVMEAKIEQLFQVLHKTNVPYVGTENDAEAEQDMYIHIEASGKMTTQSLCDHADYERKTIHRRSTKKPGSRPKKTVTA